MYERSHPSRDAVTRGTTASSVWADTLRGLKRDELAAIVVDPVALAVLEAMGRKMKPPRGRSAMVELAVHEYIERHTSAAPKPGTKPKGKKPKR
jgi:hypothetical protein